ncbi:hypothetical protein MBLNU457_4478t1 [Dothideomycetes sp. NU457]
MEFLKTCMTNVLQSANESSPGIRFNVYNTKDDSKEASTDRERLLISERKRQALAQDLASKGILARAEPGQNRIWCFNQSDGDVRKVEEHDCSFVRDGAIESKLVADVVRLSPPPAAPLHVFRLFTGAVDAVVSSTLVKICKPIRLKPLVWLIRLDDLSREQVSDEDEARGYTTLLVQVYLRIAANGSILYLTEVIPSNLQSCDDSVITIPAGVKSGIEGIIAPVGTPVKLVNPPSNSSAAAKDSDTKDPNSHGAKVNTQAEAVLRQKERVWKSMARERLRGMNLGEVSPDCLEDSSPWAWVELDRNALPPNVQADGGRRQIFLWPTSLCFAGGSTIQDPYSSTFHENAAGLLNFHDALASAEEWYKGAEARSKKLDTSPEEDQAGDDFIANGLGEFEVDVLINSPVNSRSIEMTNGGGVYPTPPDGIMPGPSTEATQAQTAVTSEPQEDHMTMEQSPTALSQASNFAMDDDIADDGGGDLFGEAEDVFGGPGITDDDFSFFDDSGAAAGFSQRHTADVNGSISAAKDVGNGTTTDHGPVDKFRSVTSMNEGKTVDGQADATEPQIDNTKREQQTEGPTISSANPSSLVDVGGELRNPDVVGVQKDAIEAVKASRVATPPLSPFAIKERLLPLPIPASTIKTDNAEQKSLSRRRNSNFGPVNFNTDFFSASSKYGALGRFGAGNDKRSISQQSPIPQRGGRAITSGRRNISLPEKRRIRPSSPGVKRKRIDVEQDDMSSEEESEYESDSDDETSVTVCSPDKKWKPGLAATSVAVLTEVVEEAEPVELPKDEESLSSLETFVQYLLNGHATLVAGKNSIASGSIPSATTTAMMLHKNISNGSDQTADFWNLFQFDGSDLIAVSQIVAEQSQLVPNTEVGNSCSLSASFEQERTVGSTALMQSRPQDIMDGLLLDSKDCNFPSIASMSASMSAAFGTSQTESSAKLQPRPVPRRGVSVGGNTAYGQYLYPIPAPLVRVNRANESWDMMHTALDYWDVLGLEPCNSPKESKVYAVLAGNGELAQSSKQFLQDLETVYEGCKLGLFALGSHAVPPDGLPGIAYCQPTEASTRSMVAAMRSACMQLAEQLVKNERTNETIVVYLLNPFRKDGMIKYVSACFWEFCKSYARQQDAPRPSNIVLQIVPMDAVAMADRFMVPDARYLTLLARSTYDASPPPQSSGNSAAWRIHCTPSVRIVPSITRKINFMLSETPPSNLMQEAQILHLSYAISPDGDWLSVAWTDYTGQHQHKASFCLARADQQAILTTVRDWTISMMPDKTTWRLIVARLGSFNPRERTLWTEAVAPHIAVTVLDLTLSCPVLTIPTAETPLSPTTTSTGAPQAATTSSFLTPVTTPQATPQTFSPDAHGNVSTPDATEAPDPDATLLDARDETWAVILPFSTTHAPDPYVPKRVLASGVLLRRGEVRVHRPLPSLGVDVVENLPPRTVPGQVSWLMPRSAEGVLREVLGWYRGLALMARLRGVRGAETGVVPWHVGVAVAGARGLNGFLDG